MGLGLGLGAGAHRLLLCLHAPHAVGEVARDENDATLADALHLVRVRARCRVRVRVRVG